MTIKPRAILYVRTACHQVGDAAATEQLVQCFDHAANRGMEVVGVDQDIGVAGSATDRSGLRRVLARVDAGDCDTIVVADLSRISRDWDDLAVVYRRLQARDVTLEVAGMGVVAAPPPFVCHPRYEQRLSLSLRVKDLGSQPRSTAYQGYGVGTGKVGRSKAVPDKRPLH